MKNCGNYKSIKRTYSSKAKLTSRGSSATTDGEHQLVSIAILQQGSEESRPVRSNNIVAGSQKGVDVVGGDLGLAIVEGQGSETGHEFVLYVVSTASFKTATYKIIF